VAGMIAGNIGRLPARMFPIHSITPTRLIDRS
jgi:hypothetical protein